MSENKAEILSKIKSIEKELILLRTKAIKTGEDLQRYINLQDTLSEERMKLRAKIELIEKLRPLLLEKVTIEMKRNKSGEDFERYLELENEISTLRITFGLLKQDTNN